MAEILPFSASRVMSPERMGLVKKELDAVQKETLSALFILMDIQEQAQARTGIFQKLRGSTDASREKKDRELARSYIDTSITHAVANSYDASKDPNEHPFLSAFGEDLSKLNKERPWLYDQIVAPAFRHFSALAESLHTIRSTLREWAAKCPLAEITDHSITNQTKAAIEQLSAAPASVESIKEYLVWVDQLLMPWTNMEQLNAHIDHLLELLREEQDAATTLLHDWQALNGDKNTEQRASRLLLVHPLFIKALDNRIEQTKLTEELKEELIDLLFVHAFIDQKPSARDAQGFHTYMHSRVLPWAAARAGLIARDEADQSVARYPKVNAVLTENLLSPEISAQLERRQHQSPTSVLGEYDVSHHSERVLPVTYDPHELIDHVVQLPQLDATAEEMLIQPPEHFAFLHEGKKLLEMTIVYSKQIAQYVVQGLVVVGKGASAEESLSFIMDAEHPLACPDAQAVQDMREKLRILSEQKDDVRVRQCLDWAMDYLVSELLSYRSHNPYELGTILPRRFVELMNDATRKMAEAMALVQKSQEAK